MSKIIESFYKENNLPDVLLNKKLAKFEKNKDIAEEFEYWIENRRYKEPSCTVEGYTASKLAELSKYVEGEGAFMLLIELRENPQKAHKRISEGFRVM